MKLDWVAFIVFALAIGAGLLYNQMNQSNYAYGY